MTAFAQYSYSPDFNAVPIDELTGEIQNRWKPTIISLVIINCHSIYSLRVTIYLLTFMKLKLLLLLEPQSTRPVLPYLPQPSLELAYNQDPTSHSIQNSSP